MRLKHCAFSTYSPKAIALIGSLPDTLQDRSVCIQLRRRSKNAYPLSGGGLFQMNVSEGWSDQIQKTPDTQANIIFRPKRGELFEFMVTPIKAKEAEAHSLSTIREAVEKSAKEIQRQALEPTLELVALEGGMAKGYFFKATEKRRLKAGEYKYLTQGILSVGEAVVPFTVLHNDSTGAVSDVALNLLRNATYKSR